MIVLKPWTSDEIELGLIEIFEISSFLVNLLFSEYTHSCGDNGNIRTENMLFTDLMMATTWNLHWESNTDLLVNLYFSAEIYLWLNLFKWIKTDYGFKLGISKGTYLGYLVAENGYKLLKLLYTGELLLFWIETLL